MEGGDLEGGFGEYVGLEGRDWIREEEGWSEGGGGNVGWEGDWRED